VVVEEVEVRHQHTKLVVEVAVDYFSLPLGQ
jgi:hypothetical protein